jgi:hypothetical protein
MGTPLSTDFIERAFLGEVISQADYCLAAWGDAEAGLKAMSVDSTYRALHSLLTHAGNISKLLWPPGTRDKAQEARMKARAAKLLTDLNLPPDTVQILSDRDLRNHLEHFDERLDTWASHNPAGLIDRNVGPVAMFASLPRNSMLRHYDPATRQFVFAGDAYDIGALVGAVTTVRVRAKACAT